MIGGLVECTYERGRVAVKFDKLSSDITLKPIHALQFHQALLDLAGVAATKLNVAPPSEYRSPQIEVKGILSQGRPYVRLVLGCPMHSLSLLPSQAISLAEVIANTAREVKSKRAPAAPAPKRIIT